MKDQKLRSPDGSVEILCHGSKVEQMLAAGWTVVDDDKPVTEDQGDGES